MKRARHRSRIDLRTEVEPGAGRGQDQGGLSLARSGRARVDESGGVRRSPRRSERGLGGGRGFGVPNVVERGLGVQDMFRGDEHELPLLFADYLLTLTIYTTHIEVST